MNTSPCRPWPVLLLAGLLFTMAAPASAGLVSRPGGLVFDDDLGVTWLRDADAFLTAAGGNANLVADIIAANSGVIHDTPNGLDTPADSGTYTLGAGDFDTGTGHLTWWGAQAWVGYLNSTNYQGYNDWRLPSADPAADVGPGNTSELGHLFYDELGGVQDEAIDATHNGHFDLFDQVAAYAYWTATEHAIFADDAWVFDTSGGMQDSYAKSSQFGAWVVRTGDTSPATVPVPATLWLFGSALAWLGVAGRRTSKSNG